MSYWNDMAADLAELHAENPTEIVIRRGKTALPAQTVRIARMGQAQGRTEDSGGLQASVGQVAVCGASELDIEPEDRFTVDKTVYRVILVRINHRAGKQAEAQIAQ